MARRGRRPNLDKKIADLIAQLKAALVAREQQGVEARVSSQVDALVRGLRGGAGVEASAPSSDAPARVVSAVPVAKRGNRKKRSAASREAQRQKMLAFWAAKRAGKKKAGARA